MAQLFAPASMPGRDRALYRHDSVIVQEHWRVPVSLGDVKDPQVEMRLLPDGKVESVKILESSGSDLLDTSLERAIKAAAPFQLPRQQFEYFRVNKMRFHPEK